jgi:hypothetical protein
MEKTCEQNKYAGNELKKVDLVEYAKLYFFILIQGVTIAK